MSIISSISNVIWNIPTLTLIISAGGYFSLRTGFFQLRHPLHCLKRTVLTENNSTGDDLSPVQAMFSALAGTLGTGSITGVAAALTTGGAGAVFWLWISSLLGMMTGFAENVLGACFRKKTPDGWQGGAMYYIRDGLKQTKFCRFAKPLAGIYAFACMCSAFGTGSLVQANSAANALYSGFGIPCWITGLALAAAAAAVIFGGIKRLGSFTSKIVPLVSGLYIAGSSIVLAANFTRLPELFHTIMNGAFSPEAAAGGVSGYIIKQSVSMGIRRGIFSNEAGLGSSVAAHSGADISEPCVHGMWNMAEIFFNSLVMCSMTAFLLISCPCNLPDMQETFSNVSLNPSYFRLTDETGLICSGTELLISSGEMHSFRTENGDRFSAPLGKGGITCSNIMKITGISALNADEEPTVSGIILEEVTGSELVTLAFSTVFGSAAGKVLSAAMALFAFSTITGRSIPGERAAVYLCGKKAAAIFRILFILCTFSGAFVDISAAWGLADIFNGIMAAVNIPVLFLLSGIVIRNIRSYSDRYFRNTKNNVRLKKLKKYP